MLESNFCFEHALERVFHFAEWTNSVSNGSFPAIGEESRRARFFIYAQGHISPQLCCMVSGTFHHLARRVDEWKIGVADKIVDTI